MKIEYDHTDFIGVYKNIFPDGFCEHLITNFDNAINSGVGRTRIQTEQAKSHFKSDISLDSRSIGFFKDFNGTDCQNVFFNGLQTCYEEYSSKYSIIKDNGHASTNYMKLQRTAPGEGYHVWHCEHGPGPYATRILVYMLYLNTLENDAAGETEFLYQQRRIKPEANTVVLWPASFTHTHRGNTVYGETNKYIVTGWFHID